MNKKIITLIITLAAVCGVASAQPKVSGASPVCEKRGYDQRIVIDTAHVRVLYALNAKDIKDEDTYIDRKSSNGKEKKDGKAECQKATRWGAGKNSQTIGVSWYSPTTSSVRAN